MPNVSRWQSQALHMGQRTPARCTRYPRLEWGGLDPHMSGEMLDKLKLATGMRFAVALCPAAIFGIALHTGRKQSCPFHEPDDFRDVADVGCGGRGL